MLYLSRPGLYVFVGPGKPALMLEGIAGFLGNGNWPDCQAVTLCGGLEK